MGPYKIFREAIKLVPATKYALGVVGIVAAIAIIVSFQLDLRLAAFGGLIILTAMTILLIFKKTTRMGRKYFRTPGIILIWFSLLLMVSSLSMLLSSLFFDKPLQLRYWIDPTIENESTRNSTQTKLINPPAVLSEELEISHAESKLKTVHSFASSSPSTRPAAVYTTQNLSFLLTNPGAKYVILNKLSLEIIDFESLDFYHFPEPLHRIFSAQAYQAVSGPIEKYKRKAILEKGKFEYNLLPKKHAFRPGETIEYSVEIAAADPGNYTYNVTQEWITPDGAIFISSTKKYQIERYRIRDTQDTYDLLADTENRLEVVSSSIKNIESSVPPSVLKRMPEEVDVRILTSEELAEDFGDLTYIIFDRSKILAETVNSYGAEKIGKLIEDQEHVRNLIRKIGLDDPTRQFIFYSTKPSQSDDLSSE